MAEANKGRANKGRCAGKLALVTGAAQGLGRAHATRLAEEGALPLLGCQRLTRWRRAGSVAVTEELHVAAQRHCGDLPACPVAVRPADQLRSEADGKDLGVDAETASHPVVSVLVDEHEQCEDQNEVRQVSREQRHGSVHHEFLFTSIT